MIVHADLLNGGQGWDLNPRRHSQTFYRRRPLTAWIPTHVLAPGVGFEPTRAVLETAMLPLHHPDMKWFPLMGSNHDFYVQSVASCL